VLFDKTILIFDKRLFGGDKNCPPLIISPQKANKLPSKFTPSPIEIKPFFNFPFG
jgi:hypothetical protein